LYLRQNIYTFHDCHKKLHTWPDIKFIQNKINYKGIVFRDVRSNWHFCKITESSERYRGVGICSSTTVVSLCYKKFVCASPRGIAREVCIL